MKNILLIALFVFSTGVFAQRNNVFYRPFIGDNAWHTLEDDSGKFTIYFPKQMEPTARIAYHETKKIIACYKTLFVYKHVDSVRIVDHIYKDTTKTDSTSSFVRWFKNLFTKKPESLQSVNISYRLLPWQPKHLTIILFPNMQDVNQQNVEPGMFVPPGVLGFTETLNMRVVVPYGGNLHEFITTLAHEIAHAWERHFVREMRAYYHISLKSLIITQEADPAEQIPLWFTEGFAELMSLYYFSHTNDYRVARGNEINMSVVLGNMLPSLSELAYYGFLNYSLGYNVMRFSFTNYKKLAWSIGSTPSTYDTLLSTPYRASFELKKKISTGTNFINVPTTRIFDYPWTNDANKEDIRVDQLNEQEKILRELAENDSTRDDFFRLFVRNDQYPLTTFFLYIAYKKKFDRAWEDDAFGVPLKDVESLWYMHLKNRFHSISTTQSADSAEKTAIKIPYDPKKGYGDTRIPKVDIHIVGYTAYDRATNTFVYYEPDDKWYAKIVAVNLTTYKKIKIARQFERKSLFFRFENTPAIRGNTIALALNKNGQEQIELYTLSWEKEKAKRTQEISFKGILWIGDISFINDSSLVFVGMDTLGQKDIFTYNFINSSLTKITNDPREEYTPHVSNNHLYYIGTEHDSTNRSLYRLNLSTSYTEQITFSFDGYLDQLVTQGDTLILRVLEQNGMPSIIFWNKKNDTAYHYRYGTELFEYTSSQFVRYPFVEQIIGYDQYNRLLIMDSESKSNSEKVNDRIQAVELNFKSLAKISAHRVNDRPKIVALVPDSVVSKPDSIKYIFPLWIQGAGYIVTTATGDHIKRHNGILSWQAGQWPFFYFQNTYYDLSSRVKQFTDISLARFPVARSPWLWDQSYLTIDAFINVTRGVFFPLDLENSISISASGGFLYREYLNWGYYYPYYGYIAETSGQTLAIPFSQLTISFSSDASFADIGTEQRHGHFYYVGLNTTVANQQILDAMTLADLRYYLRIFNRLSLATRFAGGKSFGRDPYPFTMFNMNLYRSPGVNLHGFYVNKYILSEIELRWSLLRVALLDYTFFKSNTVFMIFSINPVAFLYSGVATGTQTEKFDISRLKHRIGIGAKIGLLGYMGVYLRWERYAYINKNDLLNLNWKTAWLLEYEF
ncbi:MAG: hypothetical protein HYW78_02120 [Parcubacteria group bacterium]|nr:hypothetical protein [Parcubacteria group bacterium]